MSRLIVIFGLIVFLSMGSQAQTGESQQDTCKVFLPSAFTPNADGRNDRLNILSACDIDAAIFEVYNRWGELVYYTTSKDEGWDGISKGAAQPGGMYIWVVRYIRDNEEKIANGTVALLK